VLFCHLSLHLHVVLSLVSGYALLFAPPPPPIVVVLPPMAFVLPITPDVLSTTVVLSVLCDFTLIPGQ
jgi:hypothetical protein